MPALGDHHAHSIFILRAYPNNAPPLKPARKKDIIVQVLASTPARPQTPHKISTLLLNARKG